MKTLYLWFFLLAGQCSSAATGNANDGEMLALVAILLVMAFPTVYYACQYLRQKFHHKLPPNEPDPS